ncbi:MAG TPA: hypothetical protein VIM30_03790 [Candidatus Limnocylindrales bacterium]
MTRPATTLRILIAAHLSWTFLLTPVALEPRPFSSITPIGWGSLALIFTTVTLDIVAFVLVSRNPRTAGSLAAIGTILFVGPFVGDQLGLFSSLRPPTQIVIVEVAALLTQLAIGYVALRLRREPATA